MQTAMDEYYDLLVGDNAELAKKLFKEYVPMEEGAVFNFDEYNRRLAYLEETWSKAFVEDMKKLSRRELPPFERQRREDMDYIRSTGYWDIKEKLAERLGLTSEWEEYRAATREGKEDFGTATDPNLDHRPFREAVLGAEPSIKMRLRAASKTLQETLLKYGFVKRDYDYLKDAVNRRVGRATRGEILMSIHEQGRQKQNVP